MKIGCLNYILKGRTPVEEPDIQNWMEWFERAHKTDLCVVARTKIFHQKKPEKVHTISTVFLGINRNFLGGRPLLFESLEFIREGEAEDTGDVDRAGTWEEAEQRHKDLALAIAARLEKEHGPGIQIVSTNGRGYMKWEKRR